MICERGFGLVRIPFRFFTVWSKKNSLTVANLDVSVASRQMKVVKRQMKMKSRHDNTEKTVGENEKSRVQYAKSWTFWGEKLDFLG